MHDFFSRCECTESILRPLRRKRSSGVIFSWLILATIPRAYAIDAPSYGALLHQTQVNAPTLLEQAANVRAASAEARQARAWLNPSLNAVSENIGVSQAGVSQRENTYSVSQTFEIGGKRAARIVAGQRRTAAASALERQTQVGFASDLAIAYATAEAMQQRHEVAQAELARAKDDLRAADALVSAGREANLRLTQARASAAAAAAAMELSAASATGAMERLSALAGAAVSFTRIVHPLLGTTAARPPVAQWNPADTPALATASAERDVLSAQVRIEEKRLMPDIAVTLGMRQFGYTEQKAATIGVSLSIPLFDRNRDGVEAARERVNSAAMRMEAARLNAVAGQRSAVALVSASERRVQAAELGEAAALDAYRLGRIGYEAGKTALLELLAIRRQVSEAMERTIEARLERVRAIATLSMAEGQIAFGELP